MASQSSSNEPLRHIGRRWFLIVYKGYIYIFKSEYSIKPRKILYLNYYMKLMRFDSKLLEENGRMKWGFKILPHDPENMMIAAFACVSDEDRRRWMRILREELANANEVDNHPCPDGVSVEDEYVYLESSITPQRSPAPVPGKKPKAKAPPPVIPSVPVPRKSQEEEQKENQDEDYTSINEEDLDKVQQPKKNIPRYKPAPPPTEEIKPLSQPDVLTKEMYEFNSSDREEVERLLEDKPDGTFLVRKARNTENQVLSIEIDCQLKEFKINTQAGQVTIDSSLFFPTVEKMLIHYTRNNLPNKNIKLTKGCFFSQRPGYVNEKL